MSDDRMQALEDLFKDMEPAGVHFQNARRELLLGVQCIVDVLQKQNEEGNPLQSYARLGTPYLSLAEVFLMSEISKITEQHTNEPTNHSAGDVGCSEQQTNNIKWIEVEG